MAAKKGIDEFSNIAAMYIQEATADTFTAQKFDFPVSVLDKVGIVISRIEYYFGSLANLNSSGDWVMAGLAVTKSVSDITDIEDPTILDSCCYTRLDIGTAASGLVLERPVIRDLSTLPGGGILVSPNPLYGIMDSLGAGGVMGVSIRMYYTMRELAADEYWQLVESRRIITD